MHVAEKVEEYPADSLHPIQGSLPVGMLVWQPPLQLLEILSSLASFSNVELGPAMIASAGEADDV
ncbi:MAG TPA: hypothetical protein VK804_30320 [Bradyrhizobium sp.]|uniref:hypothetical protein n=1 Tax=Bradyrhizobium sp. TaxID=376 RepID=UPI002BB1C6FE|nr:hypothetical protein [Bradyrhizobium sp.]HTB04787.1 hypothetical protein [Bradyrhizobium sp.]